MKNESILKLIKEKRILREGIIDLIHEFAEEKSLDHLGGVEGGYLKFKTISRNYYFGVSKKHGLVDADESTSKLDNLNLEELWEILFLCRDCYLPEK